MTLTPEEMRQLEAAATPGPWRWGTGEENDGDWPERYIVSAQLRRIFDDTDIETVVFNGDDPPSEADAALIVSVRNALPALIELWEAAETGIDIGDGVRRCPFCWLLMPGGHMNDCPAAPHPEQRPQDSAGGGR